MTLILKKLLDFDTTLFMAINHCRTPFLDTVMPAISDFRILLPFLIPFLAWRFYRGDKRERILWAAGIAAVAASDLLCARVIKEIVGRARPYEVLDNINLFKSSRWLVTDPALRAGISGTLAWPSCHASNMWTAATYLTAWHGWKSTPVIILAILVSWSRLYLGVHYPLDVAGGAVTGLLIGIGMWKAAGFLISPKDADD